MAAGDRQTEYVSRDVQMADGTYEERSVEQHSDGNVPGLVGLRSYRCCVCGLAFKEDEIVMFRGKPYGVPCGCSDDIKSILFKERADRLKARRSDDRQ